MSLFEVLTHFNDIVNGLKTLGMDFANLVNKILRSIPWNWEPNVTVTLEANDLTKVKLEQLTNSLIRHEIIIPLMRKRKRKIWL